MNIHFPVNPGPFLAAAILPTSNQPTAYELLVLLGVGLGVYLILVAGAQVLRRARGVNFGWIYHLFAVSAGLLLGFLMTPWTPSWQHTVQAELEAATILLATFPVIVLLNRTLWTRIQPDGRRVDAPRLLADTTGIVIFVSVGLTVLQHYFHVEVPGLVAGSGVVAIVLGLAMQDLLGNILAGFALYSSKPFKAGDWLLVDGFHAQVIEVTWRTTRLVTTDDVVLEVPNNDLVKRPIINFHLPNPVHALRTTIGLHYNVPPARAEAVLTQAATTVPGVCAEPPPQVYVKEFAASAITYEIKFWIKDHAQFTRITGEVLSHCWYAARRAGMEIPFPIVTLHRPEPRDAAEEARKIASAALRAHAVFNFLPAAQIDELVEFSPVVLFAAGEYLVEQGAEGNSMFLLVRGRVEVRQKRETGIKVLTHLGPGDCLGEMAVLTGEKRSASVEAQTEVEAVEITHKAFEQLIGQHPEVPTRLSEMLAQRQLANDKRNTQGPFPERETEQARDGILRRLKAFFHLGG